MAEAKAPTKENWNNAYAYEDYVGRWSRKISDQFVEWLMPRESLRWLEVGCGTGALTQSIVQRSNPAYCLAYDKSEAYVQVAKEQIKNKRISFQVGDLKTITLPEEKFDAITSGLVLNFLPDLDVTLESLMSRLKSGGQMSSFIWDYAGHYQPMRHFWEAAKTVTSKGEKYDPGKKYLICQDNVLAELFRSIGLSNVVFTRIEQIATFKNFSDYWNPIMGAQGTVTEFLSLLSDEEKIALEKKLQQQLPIAMNGEIKLVISALAVKGTK